MTNKERTIRAVKALIERYSKGGIHEIEKIGDPKQCPLCIIHFKPSKPFYQAGGCSGCPLAARGAWANCEDTGNYSELFYCNVSPENQEILIELATDRADMYRQILRRIRKWSPKRFTKKGWKYVDWNEVLDL